MKTCGRMLIAVWVGVAVQTSLMAQPAAQFPAERAAAIEGQVRKCMEEHGIPGLSIALAVDDQLVFSRGFGLSDVENQVPATADTVYRTASIAKTFTAVAIMQLVEQGRIDLDHPLDEYFAPFPKKEWPITARLLLGHMSGMRHYKAPTEPLNTEHFFDVTSSLHVFDADPLLFKPGTEFLYSTFGYNLLGALVEQASGKEYAAYVQDSICKPAELVATRTDNHYEIIPHRARGYIRREGDVGDGLPDSVVRVLKPGELYNAPLHDTSVKIPGGGMVSTAPDLVRFATAINRGKLLRQETLKVMWEPQHTLSNQVTEYGLGWRILQHDGQRIVGHSGGQAGVSTYFLLCPEKHIAAAVMCNLQGQKLQTLCLQLLDQAKEVESKSAK